MPHYFAYGSNMNLSWMAERCPDTEPLGAARLNGFQLAFRYPSTSWPGGGACDILLAPGSVVWGGLYQTTDQDLLSLDDFEDVSQGGYRRLLVKVLHQRKLLEAITYEVCDKLPKDLKPIAGYLNLVLSGAEDQCLPDDYQVMLEQLWR